MAHGHCDVQGHDADLPEERRAAPSIGSISRSRTASSSCSSARPGCGKTTSLRMLAGLEDVDEGSISIDDKDVTTVAPRDRDIAMVFQNYALYPHMNVAENMGFALKIARVRKSEIATRVREAARDPRSRGVPRPEARPALRRAAPARGDGPRDRPRAARVPHGRAAVQPRREASGLDARPDRRAAAAARRHHAST